MNQKYQVFSLNREFLKDLVKKNLGLFIGCLKEENSDFFFNP